MSLGAEDITLQNKAECPVMAMTLCNECGKEISTTAKVCPNCGAKGPGEKFSTRNLVIGGIAIFVLILMLSSYMGDKPRSRSSTISQSSTSVSDANAVCSAIRSTDFALRCTVSSSLKTINLTINTTASEARKMCAGVREEIRPYTRRLGNWALRIYSPLDSTRHLASCSL